MENFDKLKEHLPEIAKIVATFPEPLQEKVYDNLVSELLGEKVDTGIKEPKKVKTHSFNGAQDEDNLSEIATLTSDGQYHSSIRDLKASSAKDATKRLIYVLIHSYTKLMKTSSVSRKKIINPELIKWRLADGNDRSFISSDKGIIKQGDEFSLDLHAQKEAEQYIQDIKNSEIIGSWKLGTTRKKQRIGNGSEKSENITQESGLTKIEAPQTGQTTSNIKPQTHSLDEIKTTSVIAQILKANSEDDLILAAAMKFDLIDKKETFDRAEILKEMQTATSYYRASFLNNATKRLKILVTREKKLRENAPGIFALSANIKSELRQKLGLQ